MALLGKKSVASVLFLSLFLIANPIFAARDPIFEIDATDIRSEDSFVDPVVSEEEVPLEENFETEVAPEEETATDSVTLEEEIATEEYVSEGTAEEEPVLEEIDTEVVPVTEEGETIAIIISEPVEEEPTATEESETVEVTPVVETPVVDTEDDTIIGTEEEPLTTSLLETRPAIFCRKNMIVINTVGDPEGTRLSVFNPELSEITKFKLLKDKSNKQQGLWDPTVVTQRVRYIYDANLKFEDKYIGYRTTYIGVALEKLFTLADRYDGTILIDEYKTHPLWSAILNDLRDLRLFIRYIQKHLQARTGRRFFDENEKPVLRLTLRNDPYLTSLTLEDEILLNSLFDVVDYRDLKTIKFFIETQHTMDDLTRQLGAGKLIYPSEGFYKHVARRLESAWANFKFADMVPQITVGVGIWLFNQFLSEQIKPRVRNFPILKYILGKYEPA